jgi:hypothetical protein
MAKFRKLCQDKRSLRLVDARPPEVLTAVEERSGDPDELGRRLAFAKHYLRHPHSELAVMVDARVAEVGKRKISQLFFGDVYAQLARTDLF